MATLGNYHIDGPSFASATSVYTDAAMTTLAADGWYSDGTVAREQISGVLGFSTSCPACIFPCGSAINASGGTGMYDLTFNAGSNTGCTIIYFDPSTVPEGIRVQYNSKTFNGLTSPTEGFLGSSSSTNYTFIGRTSNDCGIATQLGAGGYTGQTQYQWDGGNFTQVGTSGTVTGASGDVQLTTNAPGYCTLYVPKPLASPEDMLVQIFGPCSGTAFDIEINCPVQLTGMSVSDKQSASTPDLTICSTVNTYPNTYYNVPNRGGTPGIPVLHEFFVRDENGNTKVPSGKYKIQAAPPTIQDPLVVEVDTNGVIIGITSCAT